MLALLQLQFEPLNTTVVLQRIYLRQYKPGLCKLDVHVLTQLIFCYSPQSYIVLVPYLFPIKQAHTILLHSTPMEGSSCSASNINGGLGMFRNKSCRCGKKAAVKISESKDNPGKLYFICAQRQCKFFSWWEPDCANLQGRFLSTAEGGRDSTSNGRHPTSTDEEVEMRHANMHNLETYLNGRLQNLETSVRGIKMLTLVNTLCFGVLICLFVITLMQMDMNISHKAVVAIYRK